MNLKKLKQQKSIQELLEFGIINFDKPADWTSFDVVNYVKRTLGLRKTSHFGTLDPMVTGVLPVALNRACKLTGFFIGEDKEYEGVMRIHTDISLEEIKKKIEEKFIGKIMQMPPVKSRVKRQLREREIYKFNLIKKDGKRIYFRVECEGGTYIRKLIHDLGESLGIGAHMIELRRIRAGIFLEKNCITKKEFEKAVEEFEKGNEKFLREIIIPAEIISDVYEIVEIKKDNLKKIFTGKPIHKEDLIKLKNFEKGKIISVFCEDRFIGMYKIINGKDIFAKAEFVMQPISL
ncbi:MAG: RNA-guided pseudouridylation complex pseudouridine synthase subunit Cbf5 [Nanoarchaeota archaeon]